MDQTSAAGVAKLLNNFGMSNLDASEVTDAVRDFFTNRNLDDSDMSEMSDTESDVSCESESVPHASTVQQPSSSSSNISLGYRPPSSSTSESQSALLSNTNMHSVLSDVLTIETGAEGKKTLSSLFSQLLEDEDDKKIKEFLHKGCGCSKAQGDRSCLSRFNDDEIRNYRLNCFELDVMSDNENGLNNMIVAQLSALLHRDDKLMCSNRTETGNKSRKKTMMDYRFHGYSVCMNAFLFLHGIGRKRLRLLRKRVITFGIAPVKHGNAGKKPANACRMEDAEKVVTFLRNYAENNALVLPGKTKGVRTSNSRTMLLPSWESKKEIHQKYVKCTQLQNSTSRVLKLSAFVSIWKAALPNIMIQRPRSDLCVVCQKNTMKMSQMANLDDDVKEERVRQMSEHLHLVQQERTQYNKLIQSAKDALHEVPCEMMHLSFDYAQQVFLPNLPDQPGPIYFLTPFKVAIFGVANEAAGTQYNYLVPENMLTGKGANCIASMLHHYLENYSQFERHLVIHADNCVGQNKNNIIMEYLAWRVAVGLHKKITMLFLPVGHTKSAPDAGFGIMKAKFRRTEVASVPEFAKCIEDSTPVSKLNRAIIVGNEQGEVFISTYDWQNHLCSMFKPIPQLKQWHSFVFDKPGTVTCKLNSQSPESEFTIQCSDISDAMPCIITPIPVTPERQWYLYDSIRPLVPHRAQDILCPKPSCPRLTFSQVRAVREGAKKDRTFEDSKTDDTPVARMGRSRKYKPTEPDVYQQLEIENEGIPPPKRRQATCSYCHETGHINKVVKNVPACPKRRNAETVD